MQNHSCLPRRSLMALALVAAIGGAQAQDSGIGVDLQFGTDIDPSGLKGIACDPDGASWLHADRKRTPTGFLYDCAPDYGNYTEGANGWFRRGSVGVGYLYMGGDETNSTWNRFNGFDDGVVIGLDLSLQRPGDGSYVNISGTHVNSDSQYVRLTAGRAGLYRVQAFARSQSNVLSHNAKSVWTNSGSQHQTLKPGLTPGGATNRAEIRDFMTTLPEERVSVTRDKFGAGVNYFINPRWTTFVNASHEKRDGSRPFGGAFAAGGTALSIELMRPIDDSTTSVNAGLRFVGNDWRMEFSYAGSFFRNGMDHFTYEMPFTTGHNNPMGQFSYEPENDYHRIGATFTRKLRSSWNGEFSLTAALTHMRQDDKLVPSLIRCTGLLGGANVGVDCNDWNTLAAYSQPSADMGIDNQRVAGRLVLQPSSALTWRSNFNFLREDYDGSYVAFNPLTGEYGYVVANGNNMKTIIGLEPGVAAPRNPRLANIPLDKETWEVGTGLDWRLDTRNSLGAHYGYTRIDRTHREVDRNEDHTVKLNWTNRSNDWLTLRTNYSYLDRNGSPYDHSPYDSLYSSRITGLPANNRDYHTPAAFRKYEVSDKIQHKVDLMATFVLPRSMTLYTSIRAEDNDYTDAELGRYGYDTMAASVQWEWQPSQISTVSAWYGYDRSKLDMSNEQTVAAGMTDAIQDARRWWLRDKQHNHNAGANLRHRIGRATLDFDWSYINSTGDTGWRVNPGNTLATTVTNGNLSGAFPDMTYRVNSFTASVHMPLTERLSMRLFGTWERGRINDWHYTWADDRVSPVNNFFYADGGPTDYTAHMVGMMMEVKL